MSANNVTMKQVYFFTTSIEFHKYVLFATTNSIEISNQQWSIR